MLLPGTTAFPTGQGHGLHVREYFAALALCGLLARAPYLRMVVLDDDLAEAASNAVRAADYLIARLNHTPDPSEEPSDAQEENP